MQATATDKAALLRQLVLELDQEIARALAQAEATRRGATHEEARAENDKDTRALEQSYLARGQAQRVVDLESDRKRIAFAELRSFGEDDHIALSALVELQAEEGVRYCFLLPAAGGRRLEHAGLRVEVVTPEAPLGRALIGRQSGDEIQLRIAGRTRDLTISAVC
jgi:hypothetical protein